MPTMLMMGSQGSETRTLQSKLNQAVPPPAPGLDTDGIFGQYTDQAVRRFQSQRRILVDGIVGPQTWGELNRTPPGRGGQAPGNQAPGKVGGVAAAAGTSFKVAQRAKEIGFWERGVMEQPLGSNSGPKVDRYLASVGFGPGFFWCMAFVHWCYYMAALELGLPNPACRSALCQQVYNWAVNKGKIVAEPQDSDVFLVPEPGGQSYKHTGIIIRAGTGTLTTIEGNTNDNGSRDGIGVFYRTRARSGLAFVRLPDLTEDTDWWDL